MTITFAGVEVTASNRRLLGPLDLDITEPRVGIIGANGSGKSTLVRLVNGLVKPTRGTVTVNGLNVARSTRQVRATVGFVFTDPRAQLVMPTPIEDVALSLAGPQASERAGQMLASVGLADHAHDSVHTLSGGQQQLLALAAVLASEPQILIVDEPTTLLDLAWRNRIVTMLAGLPQQVIVVTHDLEHAATLPRVLVVADGLIAFDGTGPQAVAHYRAAVQ